MKLGEVSQEQQAAEATATAQEGIDAFAIEAAVVRERERCADMCVIYSYQHSQSSPTREIMQHRFLQCAKSIRALKSISCPEIPDNSKAA